MPVRLEPIKKDDNKVANKILIKGILLIVMMNVFAFAFCTAPTIASVV